MSSELELVCDGCNARVVEPLAFACPNRTEADVSEHVLQYPLDPGRHKFPSRSLDANEHPFLRYRSMLRTGVVARAMGVSNEAYAERTLALDARIRLTYGRGLSITPYSEARSLAEAAGLVDGALWVKDETFGVAGTHKGRHLFGTALHLDLVAPGDSSPLAIASCGNAAAAAAVVARASGRPLRVFVPPHAGDDTVRFLRSHGAQIELCERQPHDPPGDPCYRKFRGEVSAGALPFSVQGPDNALALDGGRTLGYELVEQHVATGAPELDRVLIQVGGGALAATAFQALRHAHRLGTIRQLPKMHAVQSLRVHPIALAWRATAHTLCAEAGIEPASGDSELAHQLQTLDSETLATGMKGVSENRSLYMSPWPAGTSSIADAILDDETYDWFSVVESMVASGGWPVLVSERQLLAAQRAAASATERRIDATGASGLAGLTALTQSGLARPNEQVAVLLTGTER